MPPVTIEKIVREAPLLPIIGMALLFVVALLHFTIAPQITRVIEYQKEMDRHKTLISSEKGYRQIKQQISQKIESLQDRLSPLPEQKNAGVEVSGFLETLIAVAKKNELQIVKIQPQDKSVINDYTLYPVLLVLTTSYHELGRFITSLEKLPHLFSVDRLAMEATEGGKCDVKLLVTCLIPLERRQ